LRAEPGIHLGLANGNVDSGFACDEAAGAPE